MKKSIDFSKGKKGVFLLKDKSEIQLPVYLDIELQDYFSKLATAKGKDLNSIVNKVLKKELELHKELSF
jgi:hypothetical protein